MKQTLIDVDEPGFSTKTRRDADTIVVVMRGNADGAIDARLKRFLDDLHQMARIWVVKEAVFDLAELYFMNSSCLSLFLRLINVVLETPSHKYTLRFRSNPNLRWQKKSLQAILSYAGEIVAVE